MRTHPSSSNGGSTPTSWMGWKEKAKREYEGGQYQDALDSYRTATSNNNCPADERQIMLSNMVACRLNIGGSPQAVAAIETAKQCIEINPQWAKGHVRLASAYVALGGHSNDACNALQRALQLDPSNPTARDMLVRELRRDRVGGGGSTTTATSSSNPSPSAPPQDQDDQTYPTQQQASEESSSSTYQDQGYHRPDDNVNNNNPNNSNHNIYIDDNITWQEKLWFYYQRAQLWYSGQSDDKKTIFKVFVGLLVLYIAFGGRFGLGGTAARQPRGNYGAGNVYDQYYGRGSSGSSSASYPYQNGATGGTSNTYPQNTPPRQANTYHQGQQQQHYQQQNQRHASSSSSYGYNSNNNNNYRQNNNYNDDDYYYSQRRRSNTGSSSFGFHFPNLFDGSIQSMFILAAIAYLCYKGQINPWQVFMFLRMMNGGGRRYGGGMGYGYGGRGGFGRRRW